LERPKEVSDLRRLQLRQLSAHAGPTRAVKIWSLTTVKEKLIKIGTKVVGHTPCRIPKGRSRDFEEPVRRFYE
jgi:hypothetical protein